MWQAGGVTTAPAPPKPRSRRVLWGAASTNAMLLVVLGLRWAYGPAGSPEHGVRLRWRPPPIDGGWKYEVVRDGDTDGARRFVLFATSGDDGPWRGTVRIATADGRSVERTVSSDGSELGPAAPDAACRVDPVDPLEHALALGWPRLPVAPVSPGMAWTGQGPEGLCQQFACFSPSGGMTEQPCVASPWELSLAELGQDEARVVGTWRDGSAGARAEATVVIDTGSGAMLRAQVDVRQPFAGPSTDGVPGPASAAYSITRVAECVTPET